MARFTRQLKAGDVGIDVDGVGRALCRAGVLVPIRAYAAMPESWRRTFGWRKVEAVNKIKKAERWTPDGIYDVRVHRVLNDGGYFDAKATALMAGWSAKPPEAKHVDQLVAVMLAMSNATPGYLLGGGHGIPLERVSYWQKLDCSSSTSKALFDVGLWPPDENYAWVSGRLATSYGVPGPGRYFTVYANREHVFTRLHVSTWWRFDTSPHGDGGRGPKLRRLPRYTSGFAARHWPGY